MSQTQKREAAAFLAILQRALRLGDRVSRRQVRIIGQIAKEQGVVRHDEEQLPEYLSRIEESLK